MPAEFCKAFHRWFKKRKRLRNRWMRQFKSSLFPLRHPRCWLVRPGIPLSLLPWGRKNYCRITKNQQRSRRVLDKKPRGLLDRQTVKPIPDASLSRDTGDKCRGGQYSRKKYATEKIVFERGGVQDKGVGLSLPPYCRHTTQLVIVPYFFIKESPVGLSWIVSKNVLRIDEIEDSTPDPEQCYFLKIYSPVQLNTDLSRGIFIIDPLPTKIPTMKNPSLQNVECSDVERTESPPAISVVDEFDIEHWSSPDEGNETSTDDIDNKYSKLLGEPHRPVCEWSGDPELTLNQCTRDANHMDTKFSHNFVGAWERHETVASQEVIDKSRDLTAAWRDASPVSQGGLSWGTPVDDTTGTGVDHWQVIGGNGTQ